MRMNLKDLSIMYSKLVVEDRNTPLTLKKDDLLLGGVTDSSRMSIEVKLSQMDRNRS